MAKMHVIDWVAIVLLIIGGIVHGINGIINQNIVISLFGFGFISRLIFGLVGVASLYSIWSLIKLSLK